LIVGEISSLIRFNIRRRYVVGMYRLGHGAIVRILVYRDESIEDRSKVLREGTRFSERLSIRGSEDLLNG